MPKVIIISDENWKKFKFITFGLAYAVFGSWFLINGESVLSYWDESWTWYIVIYLLLVCLFLVVLDRLPDEFKATQKKGKSFLDNIIGFFVGFPLFTVIFILYRDAGVWFQHVSTMPSYMVVSHLIFQCGIVATCEEIIFRVVLFTALSKIHIIFGYLVQSFIFAMFHFSAYGGSVEALFVAFLLGLILTFLTHQLNVGFAIAFHGAYNSFIIGATYIMILIVGGV